MKKNENENNIKYLLANTKIRTHTSMNVNQILYKYIMYVLEFIKAIMSFIAKNFQNLDKDYYCR